MGFLSFTEGVHMKNTQSENVATFLTAISFYVISALVLIISILHSVTGIKESPEVNIINAIMGFLFLAGGRWFYNQYRKQRFREIKILQEKNGLVEVELEGFTT